MVFVKKSHAEAGDKRGRMEPVAGTIRMYNRNLAKPKS